MLNESICILRIGEMHEKSNISPYLKKIKILKDIFTRSPDGLCTCTITVRMPGNLPVYQRENASYCVNLPM
jgi:hypothetical protein